MTGPEVTQPDPDGGVEMTDGEWATFRGVEVTAAMKAEDVDAALVARAEAAREDALRKWHIKFRAGQQTEPGHVLGMRAALAAVLSEIQAQAQQDLIADLLARHLWPVRHDLNEYPIEAVPKSVLLEHRNRLARLADTTEEPTT